MREITALVTRGRDGVRYTVGAPFRSTSGPVVTGIGVRLVNGHMANLRWFLVEFDDGTQHEVNGDAVQHIEYAARP